MVGWYKLLMSRVVTRHWPWVLLGWVVVVAALRLTAPRWDDIAADGDLAFLPDDVPSEVGRRMLEQAFPGAYSRSQLAIVFAAEKGELDAGDRLASLDVARRLHWLAAQSGWQQLNSFGDAQGGQQQWQRPKANGGSKNPDKAIEEPGRRRQVLHQLVLENLTQVIEIEESMAAVLGELGVEDPLPRIAAAYRLRAQLAKQSEDDQQAALDRATADLLEQQGWLLQFDAPPWEALVHDVWTWRSSVVGHRLGANNPQARLIVVQLDSDFAAVANIDVVTDIERWLDDARQRYRQYSNDDDLTCAITGPAAVGADMLRAAARGVRTTEMVTVVLVLLILAVVYRAPFLVAIPVTSIAVSLMAATGLIAHLARDPADPNSYGLGVFTTTRIFIVVILFGAGTDFCLFMLARNRELLQERLARTRSQMYRIVSRGWLSVHDALLASAMTTIAGLGLMWFSRFEKFRFSGPVIAISLAVTLAVCLSFTPALLSGLGRIAFWPLLRKSRLSNQREAAVPAGDARGNRPAAGHLSQSGGNTTWADRYWQRMARLIGAYPAWALGITVLLLAGPAAYGVGCLGRVTYDFTQELSADSPSRIGAALIQRLFPQENVSPVTVLVVRPDVLPTEQALQEACEQLSNRLYVDGVEAVRSLADPLGDFPPGKSMGLFDADSWRRRALRASHITRERYLSSVDRFAQRAARFDVVLAVNPFSLEAGRIVQRLRDELEAEFARPGSPWYGSQASFSGTAVGIADLRRVTQADQRRIQILVTLGVWAVLLVLLRRAVICTYLISTVLFSYFATLGITYALFAYVYGADYSGLDWKVPLFLFVILVAVGQDYNVYLVTRVFEEHRRKSFHQAVVAGLQRTGGIITSCGIVMAGTFAAMTSPALLDWLAYQMPEVLGHLNGPVLRGITELGFALSFGVLLDTLVIRSILVPAFLLLYESYRPGPAREAAERLPVVA